MTYSADNSANPNSAWGDQWRNAGRCGGRARWRPLELVAMILGFMTFWPLGLGVIAFKIWQSRSGYGGDLFAFAGERAESVRHACQGWRGHFDSRGGARGFGGGGFGPRPTGNSAFDDWRSSELSRLEEERRKLEAAEREFADHIEQLRRARDREEFDRFMQARQGRGPVTPAS